MRDRPRVLCHLIASGFAGGPEKQIVESAAHLRELGWRVVVGSFRENRPSVEVVESAAARGLETFLIDTRSPFDPRAAGQLRRCVKRFDADVLLTHGYKPNLIGRLALRGLKTVHLPIVRGYTAETWKVRLYEAFDRMLLRRMPRVLAVSSGLGRKLVAYGVDPRRIEVLHNAVDCSPVVDPIDISSVFSLPAGAEVLVAAGRLSLEKGHRFLVEAMKELNDRRPLLYAVILGSGREEARLEAQIEEADIEGRVVLGGFRKPVLGWLAAADLVVNPSLTEGLPNVVLEAMSVRTPVVATDVGGVGELVFPEKTGWLVPAGDAGALADAIDEALTNRERAGDMAAGAFDLVSEQFSFPAQARRMVELMEDSMERAGRAPIRRKPECGEVLS